MSKIKRSVSLYSYQDAYAMGRMTLEDIFVELSSLGVDGFEFISDQMMHKTPFPDEITLAQWDKLIEKYGLKPICNDIFINTNLYNNRTLTQKESVQLLTNEIELVKRLGFRMIRMVCHTPWNIVRPVMERAEKYGITLAFEIHGGVGFTTEETKKQLKEVKSINSPYLGFVIDTSLFVRKFPKILKRLGEKAGVTPAVLEYIDGIYEKGLCPHEVFREGPPQDYVNVCKVPYDYMFPQMATFNENKPMSMLDEYMPYVKHIHGKLLEIDEEGNGLSTDFKEIIDYLDQKGFDGYIATEYEGQRHKDMDEVSNEVEIVRKNQAFLKSCIEALPGRERR